MHAARSRHPVSNPSGARRMAHDATSGLRGLNDDHGRDRAAHARPGRARRQRDATSAGCCAALARVGALDYRVLLPPVAPDGGGGLPSEVATEYRAGAHAPAAARGDGASRPRGPGRCGARLAGADVVHYPLTIADPARARADAS